MLRRSILLQVCLLSVIVTISRCQEQNSELNAENEEVFGYVDNSDHSRIRSLDDGKNSPVDYSGHFGASFGASPDLNLPLPKALAPSYSFGQASEVKDLLSETPYKALNEESEDEDKAFTREDIIDKEAVKLDDTPYDFKSSSLTNLPSFDTSVSNKDAVPSGKLSYSPLGSSDYSSFDDFNYQPSSSSYTPSRYFDYTPKSSSTFEAGASESLPQKRSGDNCVDVDKNIDDRMMRCSVCTDAKGGQSENCAYAAQPKTYYNEKHYSSKAPENIRQKRSRKSVIDDPYEYIKSRNTYKSKPKEFDYSYYNSKEDEEESKESKDSYNYDFNPNDYVFEKSTSEKEGEKMVKEGKNCQQSTKDGMTCTVCVNPEGGNFEQCSYAVEPNEQKYAYVKESKFDGNGKPVVKQRLATTDGQNPHTQAASKQIVTNQPAPSVEREQQKTAQTANARFQMRAAPSPFVKQQAAASHPALLIKAAPTNSGAASAPVPSMVAMASSQDPEAIIDQQHKELVGRGKGKDFDDTHPKDDHPYEAYESARDEEAASAEELDDEDVSTAVSKEKTRSDDDDYHFNFGDVYKPDAQTPEKSVAPPRGQQGADGYFHTDESKKDVEKVFAEFIKKDRSNCKQVAKKGMTCYLCLDSKRIQNEECMYVSESQPKNTLMAYHEMQHTNQNKPGGGGGAVPAPTVKSKVEVSPEATAATIAQQQQQQAQQTAASSLVETVIKYVPTPASETKPIPIKRSIPKKSKTPKKYQPDAAAAASEKDEEEAEESEEEERDGDERMDSSEKDGPEEEDRQRLKKDPNDPEPQFDMHDEEGLFKDETKPVYSRALGYSLPRFMLERSEHEESYDEFVRGRNKNRD